MMDQPLENDKEGKALNAAAQPASIFHTPS